METIGLVGVSFRQGGSAVLRPFTIPKEERADVLPKLRDQLQLVEMIYLATCNRVELLFRTPQPDLMPSFRESIFEALSGTKPQPGEAISTFKIWAGEGAIEHVHLVAAGMDSAQVGEKEIRGQMREALQIARESSVVGPALEQIYTHSLRVATQVEEQLLVTTAGSSLAHVAVGHISHRLGRSPGPVALVGNTAMTVRAAHLLIKQGHEVLLVNRSPQRLKELATQLGLSLRSLEDFLRRPDPVEAILTSTGAKDAIFTRPGLERLAAGTKSAEAPLIVDMAVPPDVDPHLARALGFEWIGMDEINAEAEAHRQHRLLELGPIRELIDERIERFCRQFTERQLAPIIARLNKRYRQTASEGLERLLKSGFESIQADEREDLERWVQVIARRFAHIPTLGLRALAREYGTEALRTFLDASGEDFFGAIPPDIPSQHSRGTGPDQLLPSGDGKDSPS